jgi:hypothetical protein
MKKYAEDLAKDYDFDSNDKEQAKNDFYQYIVDVLINGSRSQCANLFNEMKDYSKLEFLNTFLRDDNSYHTSCRKLCICELLK